MEDKIDFVIIWVDGNDPKWQEEKRKYEKKDILTDNRNIRYRDWDNLKYWFRAVEKFAPWVNKVHFVTCGQKPIWLNTDNPKLNLVNHRDYIDEKYLPTFNSNSIEINIHRIKKLSEKFVYFNDDMFITQNVKPELFFYKGKPCDVAVLNAHISYRDIKNHAEVAEMDIINDYFHKNDVIKKIKDSAVLKDQSDLFIDLFDNLIEKLCNKYKNVNSAENEVQNQRVSDKLALAYIYDILDNYLKILEENLKTDKLDSSVSLYTENIISDLAVIDYICDLNCAD